MQEAETEVSTPFEGIPSEWCSAGRVSTVVPAEVLGAVALEEALIGRVVQIVRRKHAAAANSMETEPRLFPQTGWQAEGQRTHRPSQKLATSFISVHMPAPSQHTRGQQAGGTQRKRKGFTVDGDLVVERLDVLGPANNRGENTGGSLRRHCQEM